MTKNTTPTKTTPKLRYAFKFFYESTTGVLHNPFAGGVISRNIRLGHQWTPHLTGRLLLCRYGYHVCFTPSQLRMWGMNVCDGVYLVETKAAQCRSRHDKGLCRSYRIIGRLGTMFLMNAHPGVWRICESGSQRSSRRNGVRHRRPCVERFSNSGLTPPPHSTNSITAIFVEPHP